MENLKLKNSVAEISLLATITCKMEMTIAERR